MTCQGREELGAHTRGLLAPGRPVTLPQCCYGAVGLVIAQARQRVTWAAGAMGSDGPSQWAEWEGSLLSQGPGKQGEIEMLI